MKKIKNFNEIFLAFLMSFLLLIVYGFSIYFIIEWWDTWLFYIGISLAIFTSPFLCLLYDYFCNLLNHK